MFVIGLFAIKENLPAIILRPHREVNPIGGAALFEDKLIIIPLGTIRDIQQDARHSDHLLRAITLDIHRTPREMIGTFSPSAQSVHLL